LLRHGLRAKLNTIFIVNGLKDGLATMKPDKQKFSFRNLTARPQRNYYRMTNKVAHNYLDGSADIVFIDTTTTFSNQRPLMTLGVDYAARIRKRLATYLPSVLL
jgi:hypothetical protein